MKVKCTLALVLSATMVPTLLAGCGNTNTPAGDSGSATLSDGNSSAAETDASDLSETETEEKASDAGYTGEACEIHYAYWQDALGPYLEECKAGFEAENPDITIVLEPTAWGEYWNKIEISTIGNTVADVFQMNGPNIYKYVDSGNILSLDDYIASSSVDMSNYPEALNNLYNVEGAQYGIPMDYDTIGLWYNKELFDDAGVEYPTDSWTWDDLVDAAEKLTDPDKGVYGIAAGYADQGGFFNTVPAYGGYILSDDKSKSGFSEEATVAGIKCWIDLMAAGYSPSQASLSENADYIQFMSGKIAMMYAGDWYASIFADPQADFADKCDVQFLPTINGNRASCIHGKANCIAAGTEHPDAAWEWVKYLSGAQANEILGKSGAAIPAYTEYSHLFFEAYPQYNMDIFAQEATDCSVPYPTSKGFNEWADVVWNYLIPAYSLETSIEDACADIAEEMDSILEMQ